MKKGKIVGLWILSIFFMLSAAVYSPSFSSLVSILIVALVIPISKWQAFLNKYNKYIKGKFKFIIVVILALVSIFTAPNTESNTPDDTPSAITTKENTDSTVKSTSETTTEYTTVSTTTPTTELATEPATESTTEPTTEPATAPSTEPPHTHSFSPATCTTPKTCSCGTTEGSANGHNWKDATCLNPKTCTSCNITEGATTEHSWKDATYTSPKTCTVCSTTEGTPLDVPGKENYHGHVYTGGDNSTKYHYEADCAGKYSHEITWDDVERRGLDPCGTCVLN